MQNNRKVVIEGEAGQFEDMLARMKKQGEDMYRSFQREAKNQTSDLQQQYQIINKLIDSQRQKLSMLREEQQLVEQMRLSERLKGAQSAEEIRKARDEYSSAMSTISQSAQRQSFIVGQADRSNVAPPSRGGGGGGGELREVRGGLMSLMAGMGGGMLAGGIFNIIGNMFNEGAALEQSSLELRNLTGGSAGSPGLGLKTSEAQQYFKRFAQRRGEGNLGEISDMMISERKSGMDIGSLSFLGEFARQGGGDVGGLLRRVLTMAERSGLWGIDKGDFSALQEKMEQIGGLMGEEKKFREDNITGMRSATMLGQFGRLGGGWGDDRALERIQTLSQGIQNPANDFVRALMMQGLISGSMSRGEGTDLFGIRQRMSQGAMGENNLSDILGVFQQRFGKGSRYLQMALGTAFPQLMGNQQALMTLSNMDPSQVSEATLQTLISKTPESNVLGGRGTAGTVMSNRARLADVMAETGIKMIDALSGAMQLLIDGFEKIPRLIDSLVGMGESIIGLFNGEKIEGVETTTGTSYKDEYGNSIFTYGTDRSYTMNNVGKKLSLIVEGTSQKDVDFLNSLSDKEVQALFGYAQTRELFERDPSGVMTGIGKIGMGSVTGIVGGLRGEDIEIPGAGGVRTSDERLIKALKDLTIAIESNTKQMSGGGMNVTTVGKTGK